jgi:hypothetical protein
MKALTLYQPWASLIADGLKKVETRPRPWRFTGVIAIHAALSFDREACIRFGYNPDSIPRGFIVCTVYKKDCVQFPSMWVTPDDYGDYSVGRYGYLLENPNKFAIPVPAKGWQGVWEWDESAHANN